MYGDVGKTGKTWMLDSLCVLNRDKILYYKLILTMFPDSSDRVVSVQCGQMSISRKPALTWTAGHKTGDQEVRGSDNKNQFCSLLENQPVQDFTSALSSFATPNVQCSYLIKYINLW